jgi:hypothetical protein
MRMTGRDGLALSLDGSDDHVVAPNLGVGTELSILAWIKPASLSGDRAIIGESGSYTFKTSGASLRFTTPGIKDHTHAAALVTNQWYHVAVTFRAGETNGCKFYVNGQRGVTVNASAINTSANVTWLGRNQWGQYFAGYLDDVRVHRSVLSADQIMALYTNQPPLRLIVQPAPGGLAIEFLGHPGHQCYLLRSSNLTTWTDYLSQRVDAAGRAVFFDPAPTNPAFYRARQE